MQIYIDYKLYFDRYYKISEEIDEKSVSKNENCI